VGVRDGVTEAENDEVGVKDGETEGDIKNDADGVTVGENEGVTLTETGNNGVLVGVREGVGVKDIGMGVDWLKVLPAAPNNAALLIPIAIYFIYYNLVGL
jgi:hypothetical protein